MVQQQQMRCHGCKLREFLPRAGWVLRKFWQGPAKKWTGIGRDDGPPGACFTKKHHPLVTYGGHGMVQKQQMRCHGCKPHEFWPRAGWMLRNFWQNPATKMDLAWQRWATRSLFHNKTSPIGHIWRSLNGPAATDEVPWLQTT